MRSIAVLALAGFCSFAAPAFAAPVKYMLDHEHVWITFRVGHLGFAQAVGTFSGTTGEIIFDIEKPAASSVKARIDLNSVHTALPARDKWLLSDKALNAARAPFANFESASINVTGKNTGTITGNLTLNGVTKPVTLNVTFNKIGQNPLIKKEVIGFPATGSLKRSDFDFKTFLGPLGDEVNFSIELEAIRAD